MLGGASVASEDVGLELDPTEFSKATVQLETALSLPVAQQGSSKTVDTCYPAKATPAETDPNSNPIEVLTRHLHIGYQHRWLQSLLSSRLIAPALNPKRKPKLNTYGCVDEWLC